MHLCGPFCCAFLGLRTAICGPACRTRRSQGAEHPSASNCPASAEPAISGRLEPMLVDAKSANPGFERLTSKAQPHCCSGRTGHSSLRGCQGGLDTLSLVSCPGAGGWDRRSEGAVSIPPQPGLIDGEGLSIRKDDRALDDVLKLADIPGPVVGAKQLQRPALDAPDSLASLLGKALDQILDQ